MNMPPRRASWDEALDSIAEKIETIKQQYGARAVALSVGSIGAENILKRWHYLCKF